MRRTKPFAVLAVAVGGSVAYGETASGTVTVVEGSGNTTDSTSNYTGASDGKQMTIPFDVSGKSPAATDSDTVTAGWTKRPSALAGDLTLFTGDVLISKDVSALFSVKVTSITLLTASVGVNAVFTFSTPITLTFGTQGVGFGYDKGGSPNFSVTTTSHSNTLTGSGTESNYTLNGGFLFGTSAITQIKIGLSVTQTAFPASGKDGKLGFQLDAISAVDAVPEPASVALFGLGSAFAGAWVAARRRRRRGQVA